MGALWRQGVRSLYAEDARAAHIYSLAGHLRLFADRRYLKELEQREPGEDAL
jgi:hypothetical protein